MLNRPIILMVLAATFASTSATGFGASADAGPASPSKGSINHSNPKRKQTQGRAGKSSVSFSRNTKKALIGETGLVPCEDSPLKKRPGKHHQWRGKRSLGLRQLNLDACRVGQDDRQSDYNSNASDNAVAADLEAAAFGKEIWDRKDPDSKQFLLAYAAYFSCRKKLGEILGLEHIHPGPCLIPGLAEIEQERNLKRLALGLQLKFQARLEDERREGTATETTEKRLADLQRTLDLIAESNELELAVRRGRAQILRAEID